MSNEEMVRKISDKLIEPPEDDLVCTWCGRKIKQDEKYYEIGMDNVCTDCIEECALYA